MEREEQPTSMLRDLVLRKEKLETEMKELRDYFEKKMEELLKQKEEIDKEIVSLETKESHKKKEKETKKSVPQKTKKIQKEPNPTKPPQKKAEESTTREIAKYKDSNGEIRQGE